MEKGVFQRSWILVLLAFVIITGAYFTFHESFFKAEKILSSPPEDDFYGMKIDSVEQDEKGVVVTTTGAVYELNETGMEMWRRIDPATNSENPRLVARLEFDRNIGPFTVTQNENGAAVIESSYCDFEFHGDSLFFINATHKFGYKHINLVRNAQWSRGYSNNRIWTDGYGGSLHAFIGGTPLTSQGEDSTLFTMHPTDVMSHMVFPPKEFDFEKLYGENARPFVDFFYSNNSMNERKTNIANYVANDFGVFMVWNYVYLSGDSGPQLLSSGVMGYEVNSSYESELREFIDLAHANGFKVVFYLFTPASHTWNYPTGHPQAGQHQHYDVTLEWMREFRQDYGFDGWYFDNSDTGSTIQDYDFIRKIREDVGDEGILYNHDSVDVIETYSGMRAIMVNAYVDYTLTGETGLLAQADEPNDLYLRYFSSGYGTSQTLGAHKRVSNLRLALSEGEKNRVMGQNLNGAERTMSSDWINSFKPAYDLRKAEYLSGNFNLDVQWPLDYKTTWFRMPENLEVDYLSSTSVQFSWETSEPAHSEVSYSGYNPTQGTPWWPPTGKVVDSILTNSHSILVEGLNPAQEYEFRIRSSNNLSGTDEIIWGYVFGIDVDNDLLPDDWELKYFYNLNQDADEDPDCDLLTNVEEWGGMTNPTDSDIFGGCEFLCMDKVDNDHDGAIDCADSECNGFIGEEPGKLCEFALETSCSDGFDNDGDGLADCLDNDCEGQISSCSNSNEYGACSGIGICSFGELVNCTALIPEHEECTDEFDNNCNGEIDEEPCGPFDLSCLADINHNGRYDFGEIFLPLQFANETCGYFGNPETDWCNLTDINRNGFADEVDSAIMTMNYMHHSDESCICSIGPELCDGYDNDCDGEIDEGCEVPESQCAANPPKKVFMYVIKGWTSSQDLSILKKLKDSGLVTHVRISNLDFDRQPTSDAIIPNIQAVRNAGLIPILERDLWFAYGNESSSLLAQPFKDNYTDGSIVYNAYYYEWFLKKLRAEADELGVPLVAVDTEPYVSADVSRIRYLVDNLNATLTTMVDNAVTEALDRSGVQKADYQYPYINRSSRILTPMSRIGTNKMSEGSYYDCPTDLDYVASSGADIFGIWGTTDQSCYRENRTDTNCYVGCSFTSRGAAIWTPQTIFDNVDYWFNVDKGIWVYTEDIPGFAGAIADYCFENRALCDQYSYKNLYQETCNGVDDNCDGKVDEGLDCNANNNDDGDNNNEGGTSGGNTPSGGGIPNLLVGNECEELWNCGDWSACINGTRTRECYDIHYCGTEGLRPEIEVGCEVESDDSGMIGGTRYDVIFAGTVSLAGGIILIIFLVILVIKLSAVRGKKVLITNNV